RSPVIDGQPRNAFKGSSNRTKDSQITGANQTDGQTSGAIAPIAPSNTKAICAGFASLMTRPRPFRLKTVVANTSAVKNSKEKIVAGPDNGSEPMADELIAAEQQSFGAKHDRDSNVSVQRKTRITAGLVHGS